MQKVIFGLGVAWLLVASGNINLLYGQPAAPMGTVEGGTFEGSTQLGKDLFLTIGLDIFPHQWVTSINGTPANIQSLTAFSVGAIPTLTLTYKRFFISASYMVTPDFDFGTGTDFVALQSNDPSLPFAVLRETSLKASRQEGDVTMGYFPLDWLGLAIGWKGVFQEYEQQTRFSTIDGQRFTEWDKSKSTTSYNGPIAGFLASARINDRFSLLGNVFGGYLFTSCTHGCGSLIDDAAYASSKIVLRYSLKDLPQLSWTIGYRVQVINTFIDDSSFNSGNAIDLTHGPVLGMNYRF